MVHQFFLGGNLRVVESWSTSSSLEEIFVKEDPYFL